VVGVRVPSLTVDMTHVLDTSFILRRGHFLTAFAHSAGCGATAQLRRLALSNASISRKRHENAMSIVMGRGPKR
jgi:hypothetical protein